MEPASTSMTCYSCMARIMLFTSARRITVISVPVRSLAERQPRRGGRRHRVACPAASFRCRRTEILWANEAFGNLPSDPDANIAPTPDILRAYDVSTVGTGTLQSIWDSETEPNDRVGASTKFAPPLVAN